ncbi:hypothetical protein G3O08_06310 [Cryomorpha ignava]|uniref:T9SS type A sorting domain-containing protein n=1 Tax=Cryomorpha ignava TaxID=101383 RepID=A0A7K3WN81_9FLAO|nr:hypothetical protein [Cryomorpha ignava]NEN23109.1 hypothetical protein [Cryomorpha ignava]
MKIIYLKPLLLSFCAAWAFLGSFSIHAQTGSGSFPNYGDEGLRRVDINEIIDKTYLRDSTFTYISTAESTEEEWLLKEKAVYSYDNQGREVLRQIFAKENDAWKGYKQKKSTYISDFLAAEEELIRAENKAVYEPSIKRDFSYNYVGLISEITTFENVNTQWVADSKTSYTYNSDYLISEESSFEWMESEMKWERISRYLYTYNGLDDLKKEVFQIWVDSLNTWKNETSKVYEYNESDDLISTTRSTWNNLENGWINTSVVSIQYNDEGQFLGSAQKLLNQNSEFIPSQSETANYDSEGNIGEIVKSAWDESSGVWDNYQKQVHYWSEYNRGNLSQGRNEIECFFANPYTIGLPLYCSSLKSDVIYTVSVYDLNGRFFYSDHFLGSSSFRIKRFIESGYYIFHISGGLDSHSEKVFIKN